MTSSTLRVAVLCLLGLGVALAIAYLGSGLVSKDIGIASEPLSATRGLAPEHGDGEARPAQDEITRSSTTTAESTTTSETSGVSTTTSDLPTTTTSTGEDSGDDGELEIESGDD